jgi:ferric-dicitrate binding protein FerR (iron transport regulator)
MLDPVVYQGKRHSVDDLIRALTVASVVTTTGKVPLALTPGQARGFARWLEECRELGAKCARASAMLDEASAARAESIAARSAALETLKAAQNRLFVALLTLAGSAVFMLAGLAVWWLS